jgi:hypothetical protein
MGRESAATPSPRLTRLVVERLSLSLQSAIVLMRLALCLSEYSFKRTHLDFDVIGSVF